MPSVDLIRSAGVFSHPEAVLEGVVRALARATPRAQLFGCIYRSHPALEIALSFAWKNGGSPDLKGLHEAFAQTETFFDRWSVQQRQRERWQDYRGLYRTPLNDFWKGSPPFRRVVLCQGAKPIAYLSATLPYGETWQPDELRHQNRIYRQVSPALRIAALSWRARHSPEDQSIGLLKRAQASVVLGIDGKVLACSPGVRLWLARDAELQELISSLSSTSRVPRKRRLRHFDVEAMELAGAGVSWRALGLTPTREMPPDRLPLAALQGLTPREHELCEWLTRGLTNRQIAGHMGVAGATVKKMLERLYAKREAKGRVALVRQLLEPCTPIGDS